MLETGFAVYILMRQLADRIPSFEARMAPREGDPTITVLRGALVRNTRATYPEALQFFSIRCRRIEIVRSGSLELFYFAEPPMCQHLTARTRDNIKWRVNRESSHKKTQVSVLYRDVGLMRGINGDTSRCGGPARTFSRATRSF